MKKKLTSLDWYQILNLHLHPTVLPQILTTSFVNVRYADSI